MIEPHGGDWGDQHVLGHIGNGRDRRRSYSSIAEELNWTRRQVELAVRRLRLDGWPIGSDGGGVWLAGLEELHATIDSMQRRLVSQYMSLRALRDTEKRMQRAAYPAEQLVAWVEVAS